MTPRFDLLSVNLSKMLNDEVALATTDGKDFTSSQRALAINTAEAKFISDAVAKMSVEELAKNLPKIIYTTQLNTPYTLPADEIKVLKLDDNHGNLLPYVPVEKWFAVKNGYNPEDKEGVIRWTEMGNGLVFSDIVSGGIINILYVKDHVTVTSGGSNDLIIPARFDDDLLTLAYEFISKLLIKE